VVTCKSTEVTGAVILGAGCVLHPTARVVAADGASVTLGPGCIVEELCVIEAGPGGSMVIGAGNLFQVGCRVRAGAVGDYNVFGAKVRAEPACIGLAPSQDIITDRCFPIFTRTRSTHDWRAAWVRVLLL